MKTIRQSFIDNLGGSIAVDEPAALRHLLLLANAIDDRLASAALGAERGTNEIGAMVEAAEHAHEGRLSWDEVAQVFVGELAKMPCGLPNEHQIAEVWYGQQLSNADVHYSVKWDRARSVREYVFSCVAPIVTAKDAEISRQSQHIEDLGAQLTTLNALVRNLESRTPANEVSNAEREQYERTIEQKNARIAKLEKRLAERDIQYETLLRCKDAMGIGRDEFCDLPARIAALRNATAKMASLVKP